MACVSGSCHLFSSSDMPTKMTWYGDRIDQSKPSGGYPFRVRPGHSISDQIFILQKNCRNLWSMEEILPYVLVYRSSFWETMSR